MFPFQFEVSNNFDFQSNVFYSSKYICYVRLNFWIIFSEELNSRKRGQPYMSDWRTGLILEPPNWRINPPMEVGDWVRLFPFDAETDKMSTLGSDFEVKDATRSVSTN